MSSNPQERGVCALLRAAPRQIALLHHCQAENLEELHTSLDQLTRGHGTTLARARYPAPPELSSLAVKLESAAHWAETGMEFGPLIAARARELLLEARLAMTVGSPLFATLAAERHPLPSILLPGDLLPTPMLRSAALRRVEPSPTRNLNTREDNGPSVRSDDEQHPQSLWCVLQALAQENGVDLALRRAPGLVSRAAAGCGAIFIKPGIGLEPREAQRIAQHEFFGHLLPYLNAAEQSCSLLRVGSAQGLEAEEGRAILLEARGGWLDASRLRELELRHVAAVLTRQEMDPVQVCRALSGQGCCMSEATSITLRVSRGGGLCRELGYLVALKEVTETLHNSPFLENYLECGSIDTQAAAALAAGRVQVQRRWPNSRDESSRQTSPQRGRQKSSGHTLN
jgi:hypothetical protein